MAEREADIDEILSSVGGLRHTLHLYSSDVNKYAIQAPFLASAKKGVKAVYVTQDDPARAQEEFGGIDIELSIISPTELDRLKGEDKGLHVIIDASSIDPSALRRVRDHRKRRALKKFFNHPGRERFLAEDCKKHLILCTYELERLTPGLVKELAAAHDKLMLTRSDATILAAESLDRAGLATESVQRFVKDELESIVLALMLKEPMCGTDIIKTIHGRFNVLLSPGTIYPLLHDLEKKGLLKCEYGVKTKTYKPAVGAEEKIRGMLDEHVKASRFLSKFLQVTGAAEKR